MKVSLSCSGYKARLVALLVPLACAPSAVLAGDVHDLEEGIPVELEDVFPTPAGERQLQAMARYERSHDQRNQGDFAARVQLGFAQDWQLAIGLPVRAGDTRGSGDVELTVFKKLVDERNGWPALAASAQAELPAGRAARGIDTTLKLIATRSLRPGDDRSPRLHANLAWTRNAAPQEDERRNGYKAIAGYSQPLSDQTVIVGDVVHERRVEQGERSTVLEVGWLHAVRESTTLGLAVGAGLGEQSPRVRLTLALQQSF